MQQQPNNNNKDVYKAPKKVKSAKQELLEWLKALVIAVLITVILTQVVLVNAQVPTGSMQGTINPGDRLVGFRLAYLFGKPQRGDIVVFYHPDYDELYVKRVIGLPGETVEIVEGVVYIDGVELAGESEYVYETPYGSFGPYRVPADSYFMLGDNRNLSEDSRYWATPYVPEDKIVGRAIFRVWPNPQVLH